MELRELDSINCAEFVSMTKNCLQSQIICGGNTFRCECPTGEYCTGDSNGTFVGTCPCPIFTGTLSQWIITGVMLGLMMLLVIIRVIIIKRRKPPVVLAAVVANPVDVSADNPMMEGIPMAVIIQQQPPKQKTTFFV